MAKYRQLHISLWQDPDILELEPDEKLLFIYLSSNTRVPESGVYEISIKSIAFETGIAEGRALEILKSGRLKNISYNSACRVVFNRKFLRYNGGGNPVNLEKAIVRSFEGIAKVFLNDFIAEYPKYANSWQTVDKQLTKGSEKGTSSTNTKSNTNSTKTNKEQPLKETVDDPLSNLTPKELKTLSLIDLYLKLAVGRQADIDIHDTQTRLGWLRAHQARFDKARSAILQCFPSKDAYDVLTTYLTNITKPDSWYYQNDKIGLNSILPSNNNGKLISKITEFTNGKKSNQYELEPFKQQEY